MKYFSKILIFTLMLIAILYSNIEAQPYQWFEMNGGANDDVREIVFDDLGNMYAGGSFTQIGGLAANTIARWDGTNWNTVGTGVGANGEIMAIAVNGTDVYVGGEFTEIDGVLVNNIAKWDGVQWSAFGSGANSWVYTLATDDAGNLYAGGNFTTINGVSANYIAKWNGTNWSSLNYGTNGTVYDITCEGTDVYIAGSFMRLYNSPDLDDYIYYRNIGKWNGSEWSKITPGNGANSACFAIESDGLGNIYIGGFFGEVDDETIQYFAMWDGDEWSSPGNVLFNGSIYNIKAHFTDIYVGGDFNDIGGLTANCIAKWDGNAWESISNAGENGTNSVVECMDFDYATNSVIIGGIFNSTNILGANGAHIARFTDGSFTSAVAVPSAKSATNLGLTSFSANWRPVRGASTYYLDVATNNTFTNIVGGWNDVNVGNVTTYSVNTGLSSATTYYYRVRVLTGAGISPNSNIIQLNTNNFTLANIEGSYLNFHGDDPATQITNSITTGAVNPISIEGATIKISNTYVSDEDVLGFTNQNGITGNWDVTTGTLTLSGVASLENYQTALRSVTYFSYGIVSEQRTISFTIYGGGYSSNVATRIIRVNYSEPPVLSSIEAGALNYQLSSSPLSITNSLAASDVDNTNLAAAMVQIAANYQNGSDLLTFTDQNGITGSWDADEGAITLMGSSSIANYQTALRSVKYSNSGSNTIARTISFIVSDGIATSNTVNRQINMSLGPTNVSPVLSSMETEGLNFVEGNSAAAITNTIVVSDEDDTNIDNALVQITGNYQKGEDVLSFTNQNGITGEWNNENGKLTLTGSANLTNYQAALRSIKYFNSSISPNTSTRTVSLMVNDGVDNSDIASRKINVVSVNTPPGISDVKTDTINYTEGDDLIKIMPTIKITDDDINIDSAIVWIAKNYGNAEDTIVYKDTLGITGKWESKTGVLKLSGNSLVASYEIALRNIFYANSSHAPDTSKRKIGLLVNDGRTYSDTTRINLKIISVNDKPILSAGDLILSYTEGDGEVQVVTDIVINDFDDKELDSASIRIAENYMVGEDILKFTNQNGILGVWSAESGILTLKGSTILANYQTALRSIVYNNLSGNPNPKQRTINFTVNDGDSTSNTLSKNLEIVSVNNPPVLSGVESNILDYIIKGKGLQVTDSIKISDPDDTEISKAIIKISENYQVGEDKILYDTLYTIVGKWDVDNGTLTLTGAATIEKYEEAIRNVEYCNTFLKTTKGNRIISIIVSDGKNNSNTILRSVSMKETNSAPTIKEVETDTLKYAKGNDAVVISNNIVTGDQDNYYLFEGIVKIEEGFIADEDKLEFETVGAVEANYDEGNGVLTFFGMGTTEEYDSTLRSVKYFNTNGIQATTMNKVITFMVSDGMMGSNVARREIGVVSPLPAPTNLTATINENGNVVLKWNDNSNDEDGFIIERECKQELNTMLSNSAIEKDTVGLNSVEYCDTTATEICSYLYKVRSYKKNGILSDVYTDNEKLVFVPLKSPSGLTATAKPEGQIELCWKDNSCVENDYIIERSEADSLHFNILFKIESNNCKYVDSAIVNGSKYYYRIYAERDSIISCCSNVVLATGIVTGVLDDLNAVPKEYVLNQNYPNPFNPTTKIKYGIPKAGNVQLKIYNVLGQEVQTLVNKYVEAGTYEVEFNCMNYSSGIYLYRITSGSFSQIKKMILIK